MTWLKWLFCNYRTCWAIKLQLESLQTFLELWTMDYFTDYSDIKLLILPPAWKKESQKWKTVWDASWQNQQNDCAPSEDSDHPGHPPSLISVFAVRMTKATHGVHSEDWVFAGRTVVLLVLSWGGSLCSLRAPIPSQQNHAFEIHMPKTITLSERRMDIPSPFLLKLPHFHKIQRIPTLRIVGDPITEAFSTCFLN